MRRYSLLLVDDDKTILSGIGMQLELEGYEVTTASSGEDAIDLLNKNEYNLVITDLMMKGVGGLDVLKRAKQGFNITMVIILTGYGDLTSAIEALRMGADDFLIKPCDPQELSFRITDRLGKLELQRKVKVYEKLLPICSSCKKIRDDAGKLGETESWLEMEEYFRHRTRLEISSTVCPACSGQEDKTKD